MLKRAAKAAGRHAFNLTHLLVEVAAGLLVIALVLTAALAARLSEGPLRIDALSRPIIASFNRQSPTHIRAAHILLAWAGWRKSDSPVQLRVEQLEVTSVQNNTETSLALLPEASVSLSLSRLLIGELRPVGITFDSAALKVTRAADGTVTLDLGDLIKPGANASPFAALAALGLLGGNSPTSGALAQLRALRIHDVHVSITDQKLAANWSIDHANLDFLRDQGVWRGTTSLPLTIGAARLTIAGNAVISPDGASQLKFSTTTMMPSDLAKDTPGLAFFAALEAPLSLGLSADLTKDFALRDWNLEADLGAGDIATSRGTVKIASGRLVFAGTPTLTRIESLAVDLPVRNGAAISHLTASGQMIRDPSGLTGNFTLKLDQLGFADLPELWPVGVIPKTRGWVTNNITAGNARDLHVEIAVVGQPDFTGWQISSVTGGFTGTGITLTWIKEVPPITNADVGFSLLDRDHIMVAIKDGKQQTGTPTPLTITGGSFGMTSLASGRPIGTLSVDATGALPDLLYLLAHPRLHLLSRTPLPFTSTSGAFAAHFDLSLPLIPIVPINEMTIGGTLHATSVHLGNAAAGHDLDRGTVDLTVNNQGLTASGHGDFAQMPADITYHTDFQPGAPGDVMQQLSAKGVATPAQLAAAGYDPLHFLDQGQVAITVNYSQTHDRNATLVLNADLANASLTPQFGWRKIIGTPGQATGTLDFAGNQVVDVPNFSAAAPQMSIAGQMTIKNNAIAAIVLHSLKLNQSDLSGEIDFPAKAGDPYRATLRGPVIDLSGAFKHDEDNQDESQGPHYTIDAAFDRAVMADGESMSHLVGRFESNRGVIRSAAISFGLPHQVTLSITPTTSGRSLLINATDAGTLLRGTDTLTDLRGGTLSLQGTYDDSRPHHPLSGSASIDNFKMSDAPAITKLLQAMTGYGLIAAAQGGGLAITSLKTSFQFQQNILTLENAQAHSASIGFTARGTVDIATTQMDIRGTIVPAYILNHALSNVPLVGGLFASEKGGGALAANFHVTGPHDDPKVSVNLLSVLTPGFLRGLFGGSN